MKASIRALLRQALTSVSLASALCAASTVHAEVYEYSFTGWVNYAYSYGPSTPPSSSAYGLASGSTITGSFWFDTSAPISQDFGTIAIYNSGLSTLSINGIDLSAQSTSANYVVVDSATAGAGQYDSLNFNASLPSSKGPISLSWYIAAPTSWLSGVVMPDGLPVGDLLLVHSGGAVSTQTSAIYGSEQLQFRFSTISPVPEPSTYALMLAGLAVVGGAAARRRSRGARSHCVTR